MTHGRITEDKPFGCPGVLCILGRGIEKVSTNVGEVWRPTRYIELLSPTGTHTGQRVKGIGVNDDRSVIAGANANLLAACELFKMLQEDGRPPHIVVFAAGRPKYLIDEPDPTLTEGRVLEQSFVRRINIDKSQTRLITLATNRDTKDDIEELLILAKRSGINEVAVITVAVHVPRAREFGAVAIRQMSSPPKLDFLCAEDLLAARYRDRIQFASALTLSRASRAFERTREREDRGIRALRSGQYNRAT